MPDLDELPEPNAEHHGALDRRSILRSTVPKRKGPTPSRLKDFPENHSNHKFLDLIQYYECLDHRSSTRPAGKDKIAVSSSASTTPDLPEYESSSTGSRSTATPDFLFPKPSSVISDSDFRTDSPDLGYSSKRGSRQYEDTATSSSGSRNISPEDGFRNMIPFKKPFKSYGDMRYLLDLKIPSSSDSESNSLPKSDLDKKPYGQNLGYKLDSCSISEFNSSEKISDSKYADSLEQKMALESDGTSESKRSSFCIEELDPESFTNLEDLSFEVTLGKSLSHTQQMESLERKIGNMSSIIEQDDTLKNKCFNEDSDNPESMEKDPLNYTNLFEYEAPNNLESDYARYKLAFDITESDFSANLNTPVDDETDESTLHKFYSRHKKLSQSTTDEYDDYMKRSLDLVDDKDTKENTTLGNSQDFQYDGILDNKLSQKYPIYEYEHVNESSAIKLFEVEPRSENGAKSGSSMSQYFDLKFDEYSNELYNLENGTLKASRDVPEIRFSENMFTIDCEKGRPGSELKNEYPKVDRPEMNTPDSMFSFACEDKPGSRMSNFSLGLNDDSKVNLYDKSQSSTEKLTEDVEEKTEFNPVSSLNPPRSDSRSSEVSFSLKYGSDEVRPDSRLSDMSCGFTHSKIPELYEPSTSPRLDYMPEPKTRYSLIDEKTKVHRGSPDLVQGTRETKSKCFSLDSGTGTKPVPHYMDNLFPTSGYRYSLPKPSDFLSDSFIKREVKSQNQSLNLSVEPKLKVGSMNMSMDQSTERTTKPLNQSMNSSLGVPEIKQNAMRNFISSCINDDPADVSLAESTASSIPPPLPSQPPPSINDSGHHKMKIDLHTVDYIMNNRRRSCLKKDSSHASKDFADDETIDDHNYSIVSLIGALEELGIEVEFNEPDEQHRRRTMGRNTSLMESVLEEDEEGNEVKQSAEESRTKIGKQQLNEIKEADEIVPEVRKSPSPVFNTPTRFVHQPSEAVGKSSENKTEETNTENNFDLQTGTPKDTTFRLERLGSPVLSSSKKLKFLQRRSEMSKANLEKVIDHQPPEPPTQNLESTRQLFVDSSVKICKLDNSISTISMTTSASREVSPVTETPRHSIIKESSLAPTNLCKVLDAEDFRQSRNSEFDKIERYAKVSTMRTGKVEKVKRNSFTRKYPRVNRKCKDTTTVESIPSVVENFLTDALGSEKDNYETTMVDDTFANTNDIEFTDSNLFTADESGTVDLDRSLMQSISDHALNPKTFLKNTTRKKKSSRRRWSELQEEMHVLLDSVSKQQLMIQQASKALKMCYTFKEFENSEEHVESERILLLAHKRKTAAMDAINHFSQKKKKLVYENYGDIALNNIVLPLNTACEKYDKKNDSVEWYMVMIQNGLTVLGSQPVMRQKNSKAIVFPDPFFLPKVDPDFKLTFEVYRLKLKKKGGISHELKYHIRGSYSLADAWYKAISKLTQRSNPSKQNRIRLTKMFESSFMLIGQTEFSLKDLSRSSPWTLQEAHPILEGTIKMSFSCNVDLTESNAGWLTHGTDLKGYTLWNRRWCVLVGHVLKFWDYPTEDPEEKPIMELDLIHCKDSEIGVVDREFCAKPRTIMLEFDELKNVSYYDSTNDSNIREQRNFLTLDTNRDLDEWLTKINRVLQALKNWNAKC